MNLFPLCLCIICWAYMILNFKYDLQMFQQNSYRNARFWRWLKKNFASTQRLVNLACCFILASNLLDSRANALIVTIVAIVNSYFLLSRKSKLPLVFTKRVWRLYTVSAVLSSAITVLSMAYVPVRPLASLTLITIFLLCFGSWAIVMLANIILIPVEKHINNGFINDAKRILASMPDLKIVGITGSYGKTSTKHYLHRILSEKYDTLMTPGSFNTPMGVVRTIREHLKPYNEVFICEMGAKQKGDIKEICDIVNPEMGIVTAVGPMHLETFKSIENVQSTKFELVDALPQSGLAVINNDFEMCANRPVANTNAVRYGVTNHKGADYVAENIHYSSQGTDFDILGPDNWSIHLSTKLLGECNVSDILAAVCIARALGVEDDKIKYAVASIERVEHRLSIKTTPGGVTIIDDAFNSNPAGSKMAVDVLAHFTDGKRIIVTPGMIELGSEQFNLNKVLGQHIGNNLDVAIIVGEYNRAALVEGVQSTDFDLSNLHTVATFNDAQKLLQSMLAKGDTVLYENDLPDTFK